MHDATKLAEPAEDALDRSVDRSRWMALVVLCTGMLMIVLDVTIVNVALPSIQADLGFSQTGLAWVVNAYLIAFGGLLLLAGRLGDLAGRRNVFLAGLDLGTLRTSQTLFRAPFPGRHAAGHQHLHRTFGHR